MYHSCIGREGRYTFISHFALILTLHDTCSSLIRLYKKYSDHVSHLMPTKWYLSEKIIYQCCKSVNAR